MVMLSKNRLKKKFNNNSDILLRFIKKICSRVKYPYVCLKYLFHRYFFSTTRIQMNTPGTRT